MEWNSTTYMYICFKIRGEVWKNCKSWERNQDCTKEVSRQPARYHLQETLGASHHLLQEERHPGTQQSSTQASVQHILYLSFTWSNTASNPPLRLWEQPRCHSTCWWFQGIIQPGCQMSRVFALLRKGSKGRESLSTVALRKQTENQTSLPWKVKHREDSSPFINKAGREWENFYKLVTENNTRNVWGAGQLQHPSHCNPNQFSQLQAAILQAACAPCH